MLGCRAVLVALFANCLLLSGCMKSSPPGTTTGSTATDSQPTTAAVKADVTKPAAQYWEDYPDVPKVEIMTEVDGIKIPRMPLGTQTMNLTGPIVADVGNEHAKKSTEPVTGDTLTIRFGAEPKVLNTITENSAGDVLHHAVCQRHAVSPKHGNVRIRPPIAKSSIIEDSIKLSADYPGRERRISLNGGPQQPTLELDYLVPAAVGDKPAEGPKIPLATFNKDGTAVGKPGSACIQWFEFPVRPPRAITTGAMPAANSKWADSPLAGTPSRRVTSCTVNRNRKKAGHCWSNPSLLRIHSRNL